MEIRFIVIAICLIVSLGLGFGIILPKHQGIKNLQFEIEKKEIELRYKEEYFSHLWEISEKLKEFEKSLAKIDSAIPQEPSLPSLFNFLEKISSQSGLLLKKVGPVSSVSLDEKPEIQEHSFSISLLGSYSAFKNFLTSLEKSARLIEVKSISFSSPKKGTSFDFNLLIKVHSY